MSLAGVRILDLGRVLAAPWATQVLADLGAEVIKVERPGNGSDERVYGPGFLPGPDGGRSRHSAFHNSANRNKQSITIDLASPGGHELVLALAAKSDVLVENFVPGKAAKLGLGYDDIKAVNPAIIYASLSGYGQTGPLSERPGYDAVFQARSGLMNVTGIPDGEPGGGPMRIGPSLVDVTTGYNLAIGILAALYHRDANGGQGQQIDVALMDTAVAMQSHLLASYLVTGRQPPRQGFSGNGGHPATVFECIGGRLYISAGTDQFWVLLCKVLGCEELLDDPRFASITLRGEHRDALNEVMVPLVAAWPIKDLFDALEKARVPCSPINDYAAVMADEQVRHRGIFRTFPGAAGVAGEVPTVASPIRMSATPIRYEIPPPEVGEHTDCVLAQVLGMDKQAIESLRKKGVVG
ncbi:MAG TPA: CoA transferase [Novosphingobium sp.]|nr:CoA transferase [Novosphingobium sp.]